MANYELITGTDKEPENFANYCLTKLELPP